MKLRLKEVEFLYEDELLHGTCEDWYYDDSRWEDEKEECLKLC